MQAVSESLKPVPDSRAPSLSEEVSRSLEQALSAFKDSRKGLRILSRKMGIHEKTLRRLLAREHRPGYVTLYKIYRVLTQAPDDVALLEQVPAAVREELIGGNPKPQSPGVVFRGDLEKDLLKDQVFAEIYFAAAAGGIRRPEIQAHYGRHGLKILDRMLLLRVLKEQRPELYVLGENQVNLTSTGIKHVALSLSESFAEPGLTDDPGQNYMAVFAEGLSPEAYSEWLRIEEEAFRAKTALARDPRNLGPIRAFTVQITDQIRIQNRIQEESAV